MSQFYASIRGNRGEATRMGTKATGIHGHIRGWDVGVEVHCRHYDGHDIVEIRGSGGSCGCSQHEFPIATLRELPNGGRSITLHKPNGKPSVTYKVPVR